MTATRIVTLGGPIPASVGIVETRRKHEEPNVTTVTRMAPLRRQKRRQLRGSRPREPHPFGVPTFERFGRGGGGGPYHGGGYRIPRTGNIDAYVGM